MQEIKKLAKSLLPSFIWILAVASSCVWVFMLFCTMKSEKSKLDKRFDLVLLTFKELDVSDICLAHFYGNT